MATETIDQKVAWPVPIKNEALFLDARSRHDIKLAARLMVEGKVVIIPVCGVMGFMCDATQEKGASQIYNFKDRDRKKQLVAAGGAMTRLRLVERRKLHPSWGTFDFSPIYDIPTFVVFPSVAGLPGDFIRPDVDDGQTDTIAIWWANFYRPMLQLEGELQKQRPDAFIGGSSCNRSEHESITRSDQAFQEFGRGSERVAAVVFDREFDRGNGLMDGSHTMLKISGSYIKPLRAGCVHTDSYQPILGKKLKIPEGFTNLNTATLVDHKRIQRLSHYLKKDPTVWQQAVNAVEQLLHR